MPIKKLKNNIICALSILALNMPFCVFGLESTSSADFKTAKTEAIDTSDPNKKQEFICPEEIFSPVAQVSGKVFKTHSLPPKIAADYIRYIVRLSRKPSAMDTYPYKLNIIPIPLVTKADKKLKFSEDISTKPLRPQPTNTSKTIRRFK